MPSRAVQQTLSKTTTRLIRMPAVEEMTGFRRSWIYVLLHRGEFPRPLKTGTRSIAWKLSDVEAWCESRPVAHRDAA
jgi:prophage regulatory protein